MQKFLLGAALLTALVWNLAQAGEIKGLHLDSGATGTRAEIALDSNADFKVISLKGPDRLVVDLPASSVAKGLRLPAPIGIVRAVRTGQPTQGTARIVFELTQPVAVLKPRIEQGTDGPRLVLEWPDDGAPAAKTAVAAVPALAPPIPAPATTAVQLPSANPTAASSEATSRLISELASRDAKVIAAAKPLPGSRPAVPPGLQVPPAVKSTTSPASQVPAAVTATTSTGLPARIATGVPTRVATGQPATVPNAPPSIARAEPPVPQVSTPPAAVRTFKEVMRGRGMRELVIAIDPGHGGQDPGAIGLVGNREKDVTLAIARELARQINATAGMRAFLTRDTDVFIPLNKRARLARSAKADMFVSIHADAAENRNAKGSSVYVLSLKGASSQRARWLADKENSSDLIGGVRLEQASNTLASVLLDLTQSGHMRASEDAANHVLDGLKRVGANHTPRIERANFAVLRTSDMPAMLVETAFISNPEEERRLIDPAHQRALARAVLDGVNAYFVRQPPPGTMYAARAESLVSTGAAGGTL
ncbi:MAG: N-acetylmuramoyl-L-alanine amidase [Pseudoxanthomonas sp.]